MQNTMELEHLRDTAWIKPAALCGLGIAAAAVGGAAAGWLDWRLRGGHLGISLFNLMALAVVAVLAIALTLTQARIRSRWAGLAAALAMALVFQGCSELAGYALMRQGMAGALRQSAAEHAVTITQTEIDQAIDQFLQSELGAPGLVGFALARARTDTALLVIRLLVGVLAAWLTWSTVYDRPYCATCGDWYGRPVFIGALAPEAFDPFLRQIVSGELSAAGQMLGQEIRSYPRVMVYTVTCKDSAAHDSLLIANLYQIPAGTSRPQHKALMQMSLNGGQLANLRFGLGVPGAAR